MKYWKFFKEMYQFENLLKQAGCYTEVNPTFLSQSVAIMYQSKHSTHLCQPQRLYSNEDNTQPSDKY